MSETEIPQHDPFPSASRHVLGRLGLAFAMGQAGAAVELDPDPVLLDAQGHLSFGALGVLFDMASSTALDPDEFVPFVHADITVHRLRAPQGAMIATSHMARRGKRTAIVVADLHDATGALVASSTQEIAFRSPSPRATPEMARMRESFRSMFDGVCRLDRPLEQDLEIAPVEDALDGAPGTWTMALGPDRTNGFGGLHGGVATTLIDVAASGAVAARRGTPVRTTSAAVRYLAPALAGPFRVTPEILHDDGHLAVVRAPVLDTAGTTVILADVHVSSTRH